MVVIPTKVGIQYFPMFLDSRFRRNDKLGNDFDMTVAGQVLSYFEGPICDIITYFSVPRGLANGHA